MTSLSTRWKVLIIDFMNNCGIKTWLRYRDDFFAYVRLWTVFNVFFSKVRLCAGSWKLLVEEINCHEIAFLDICIFKNDSRLSWKPYRKESKQFIPLTSESSHPVFVHSWPVAEATRLARNSWNEHVYQTALVPYVHDLISTGICGNVIARVVDKYSCWSQLLYTKRRPDRIGRNIVCALSYHPVLALAGIGGILKSVFADFGSHVSWLFGGRSVGMCLRGL